MNKLIIIAILSVSFISVGKKINGLEMIPGDDPKKFNWTDPDLFRWSLDLKEKHNNYIEDKEKVVLRGKGWSCKVSKTKRETWAIKSKRYFSESRKVVCSSGSFKSQIDTTCKLALMGKKVVLVYANTVCMDVGVGKELNSIFLRCETWHDHNQNNKHEPFEWRENVLNWKPGECGKCLWE